MNYDLMHGGTIMINSQSDGNMLSDIGETSLKSLLNDKDFRQSIGELVVPIGLTEGNKCFYQDMSAIPNMLVCGTTGSGKTAFVISLLSALMFEYPSIDFKVILVDTKGIDYSSLSTSTHLLVPIIKDINKANGAIRYLVTEAEKRINIIRNSGSSDDFTHWFCVLDDYYDLSNNVSVTAELQKLLKIGRVAKIHCIICTSTPTAKVISTELKANIPCRIAFSTASKLDSRIILDENGAESLNAPGELFFRFQNKPIKCKGLYISDDEVTSIVKSSNNTATSTMDNLGSQVERIKSGKDNVTENTQNDIDSLYSQNSYSSDIDEEEIKNAISIVQETGSAATSILQRRLKIGYTRASHLVNIMEDRGIIGTYNGGKPREILIGKFNIESVTEPEITLTPQKTISYDNKSICVKNNKVHIEIKKRISIGETTCDLDLSPEKIQQLVISKPTIIKKGYICFALSEGLTIDFGKHGYEITNAFGYLSGSKKVLVEFDRSNMPFFKRFIEQLGEDLSMPVEKQP